MSSSALVVTALALLAGCPPVSGGDCALDDECAAGDVCARDHQCASPSDVYEATVSWTVGGQPASSVSCESYMPNLTVTFGGAGVGLDLSFAPVPCRLGQFFIDRLPRSYDRATIDIGNPSKPIISGSASFDLN